MEIHIAGKTAKVVRWRAGDPVRHGPKVAIDTETHLIDDHRPWIYPPMVVMTVYSGGPVVDMVMWRDVDEYLDRLFKEDRMFIFHNAPFDIGVTGVDKWINHIEEGRIYDTGLQWVLEKLGTRGLSDENKRYPSLADVARDHLDMVMDKDSAIRLTFNREEEVDDAHAVYACTDAIVTWRCCELMGEQPTMDIQVKGFMMLDNISRNGLLVDMNTMEELRNKYVKLMDEEKEKLLSWGIDLDTEKTATQKFHHVMTITLGLTPTMPENPDTEEDDNEDEEDPDRVIGKPENRIWLIKRILREALENRGFDPEAAQGWQRDWGARMEREFKAEIKDLPPISSTIPSIHSMTKAQVIGLLYWLTSNIGHEHLEREMEIVWAKNNGWVGPKEGSETAMQRLMQDAEVNLGMEFQRTEKSGKIQLTSEVFESLSPEVLERLPFLESWRSYKASEKLYSTFLNPENVKSDGRVHPRVTPIVATGRSSMSAPNLFLTNGGFKTR